MDVSALKKKAVVLYLAAILVVGAVLFIPAGTFGFWQAWLYMAVLLTPVPFVGLYFLKHDPELLERRFKTREKEVKQKAVIKFASLIFLVGFIIPGLDWRFGWSSVPFEAVIAANALVFIGYAISFLAMRENSYAARTIEVEKGQKVISTGPYSVIRHPMYVGVLLIYIATPIALGSYWALPPFLLLIPVIVFRILNEEDVLLRKLQGYKAYCKKVRYRLLPHIW